MCIVIDVNRIPSVLNPGASDHDEFRPILDWIQRCNAKIVYGGTTYKAELSKLPNYLPILSEMKRAGQVHEVDDENVDQVEGEIGKKIHDRSFNDQAIVAIVIVSHCRLVCSNDTSSFPFLKLTALYPKGVKRPSIYTGRKSGVPLLNRVLGKCGPCALAH
jgi:hypothetical protein